jgi:hypothetical protein
MLWGGLYWLLSFNGDFSGPLVRWLVTWFDYTSQENCICARHWRGQVQEGLIYYHGCAIERVWLRVANVLLYLDTSEPGVGRSNCLHRALLAPRVLSHYEKAWLIALFMKFEAREKRREGAETCMISLLWRVVYSPVVLSDLLPVMNMIMQATAVEGYSRDSYK